MPTVRSWKTTVAGIVMIVTGLGNAVMQYVQGGLPAVQWETLIAAVVGGFGLIFAKDADVSNSPTPGPAVQIARVR
jgi:hypothetical protein